MRISKRTIVSKRSSVLSVSQIVFNENQPQKLLRNFYLVYYSFSGVSSCILHLFLLSIITNKTAEACW